MTDRRTKSQDDIELDAFNSIYCNQSCYFDTMESLRRMIRKLEKRIADQNNCYDELLIANKQLHRTNKLYLRRIDELSKTISSESQKVEILEKQLGRSLELNVIQDQIINAHLFDQDMEEAIMAEIEDFNSIF